jgi:DNA-binding response OmpR family regulator
MSAQPTSSDPAAGPRPQPSTGANRGLICVVHGDAASASVVALAAVLRTGRYDVLPVGIGRSSIDEVAAADPDLVILLGAAGRSAIRVCTSLHDAIDCPVLVVVEPGCKVEDRTIVDLLDAGAANVLSAPTAAPLLLAGVRVALRSSARRRRGPQHIVVGDVVIDLEAHAVLVAGEPTNCPPLQFDALLALASNPGVVLSRDTLIADVWGIPPASVHPRRVRIAMSLLRRLIGTGPQRPRLESVTRIGYRLVVPPVP